MGLTFHAYTILLKKLPVAVLQITVSHWLLPNIIKEPGKAKANLLKLQNNNYFTIRRRQLNFLL